jgi:hypothetical protein
MSLIIRYGATFHGINDESRGVFTNDKRGFVQTYAGQCKDGYACGLGVLTNPTGLKEYAEHGPDGEFDGRWLRRNANRDTFYRLYERGGELCCLFKDWADVNAGGTCKYNGKACAPDDPRLRALIAQVAPVEVRPAAPAPHPLLGPPLRPHAIVRWIGRLVLPPAPPQALATAVATEVHPHAARRRWWPCDTSQAPIALQSTTTQ